MLLPSSLSLRSLIIGGFLALAGNSHITSQEILVPPLEIKQDQTPYNYQSARGVPIPLSMTGSDERLVAYPDNLGASSFPPTDAQFSGLISFGGLGAPGNSSGLVSSLSLVENAQNIELPRASNGISGLVLNRGLMAAPYISRPVSFLFGGIIPLPDENEDGDKLDANIRAESYWRREPFLATGEDDISKGYYFSPHAETVFAIQAGQVSITWQKIIPETSKPDDYYDVDENSVDDASKWVLEGGKYYRLYQKRYLVSGSAAKEPRTIYWNTAGYNGPQVEIPTARIQDLKFVYNSTFPEEVENGIPAGNNSYTSSGDNAVQIVVKKTLWRDGNQLRALNVSGRIFVELLGDIRGDGKSRQHLGFEIVDVRKYSVPSDITVELGDRITHYRTDQGLQLNAPDYAPSVVTDDSLANHYAYEVGRTPKGNPIYHAVGETFNLNDYQIYWMQEGIEGIEWPKVHGRYRFIWPTDPGKYSHYARPAVTTSTEAETTAIQLPVENSPALEYQDSLDEPRGFLNASFAFYSYLTVDQPQHRALIRYTAGGNVAFERVFSWLDTHLQTGDLDRPQAPVGSLVPARHLSIWGSAAEPGSGLPYNPNNTDENGQPLPITHRSSTFLSETGAKAPRIINNLPAIVGKRLVAPGGEQGSQDGEDYLAAYIIPNSGTLYHPSAYIDPLSHGFEKASKGAIIPVNAIDGLNHLEVLWFRRNKLDESKGFLPVYWPSVKASYTLQWPTTPDEIVLASNAGSGELSSLAAQGSIYRQPLATEVGYNPNEEHALMLAGRAYALRDDLNITQGNKQSSEPYVLVDYVGADGRPSMEVFHVLREKPDKGLVFDYILEAGTMLQAPMPLPLLEQPTYVLDGRLTTRNTEIAGSALPNNWNALASATVAESMTHYPSYTYEDRKQNKYLYRGRHEGPPALKAGYYNAVDGTWSTEVITTVKADTPFKWHLHASQIKAMVSMELGSAENLPEWLSVDGHELISLSVPSSAISSTAYSVPLVVSSLDGVSSPVNVTVSITVLDPASSLSEMSQAPLDLGYVNAAGVQVDLGDRAPYLAEAPSAANSFQMEFYYRNQGAFDWPGLIAPADKAIVPFLRPVGTDGFVGNPSSSLTASQRVVYRPVWPANTPEMKLSETLVKPKRGLPDIAGQASLRVLYQQAIANSINGTGQIEKEAVKLHDPTRARVSELASGIPSSATTSSYNGLIYFPKLPPHLASRFYLDPRYANLTATPIVSGQLTLIGEFKDETVGEDYLLLNVLDSEEIALLKGLCESTDPDKTAWDRAIDGLNASEIYEILSDSAAVDSYALSAVGNGTGYVTLISNNKNDPDIAGLPVSMHVLRVGKEVVRGELKVIYASNPLDEQVTFQHSPDLAGHFSDYQYEWFISAPVDGVPLPIPNDESQELDAGWISLASRKTNGMGEHIYTLGGSGIQSLSDNYLTMRYRCTNTDHPASNTWSDYMVPQLAEGWIKRVLAGINPFNQRVTDLLNNAVNTNVSLVAQAGTRWEGNIALNLDNMNDHGLIEIYETVLNRGKNLSIDSGINYGPANDALLLAAGYLNDLYMILGNEALADALNPTIGIGTADQSYGDIATSMFSFKGQVPTLLEEELGLLRGRDDFLQPGVETAPVYNRMFWNYTRGIDSGEVIYALNYNIQEYFSGGTLDGIINADDAAKMYPTGHGDAYGHYLSAVKGYYRILIDADFDWNPRTEAVSILGKPVQVDYLDERKFAAAASALSNSGQQIMELTWRKDYQSGDAAGWTHLHPTRSNTNRMHTEGEESVPSTRYWGVDHWANRVATGTYINWVVSNGMLPSVDPDPSHEGIQKIDRTTVPEIDQLAVGLGSVQQNLDTIEAGMTPLGIAADAVTFDINPNSILGGNGEPLKSHFEQFQDRAASALQNAVVAFDDAKDVTRMMRGEEDDLGELNDQIELEEFAYTTKLIEIFGQPYAGDIGPEQTYAQGYVGPDLLNWAWVESFNPVTETRGEEIVTKTYKITKKDWLPENLGAVDLTSFNYWDTSTNTNQIVDYKLAGHGYPNKPKTMKGTRGAVGKLQTLVVAAQTEHFKLETKLDEIKKAIKLMDTSVNAFRAVSERRQSIRETQQAIIESEYALQKIEWGAEIAQNAVDFAIERLDILDDIARDATPTKIIVGFSNGGDILAPIKAAIGSSLLAATTAMGAASLAAEGIVSKLRVDGDWDTAQKEFQVIDLKEWEIEKIEQVNELVAQLNDLDLMISEITLLAGDYQDAREAVNLAAWEGARLLEERTLFRKRASALIQGYRTRDAAFRIFRSERLERYKSLYDLAATYTYLAAKAFDYETGLLGTDEGKSFIERIVASRALGVVKNGQPQFAASNTGDPGLSSVLAELSSEWAVLKGRLGINNPDTYGTTVSLRTERYRIFPDESGDANWKDLLKGSVLPDLRTDPDVMRYCMQINSEDRLPIPGIVLDFSTTITDEENLFGHYLAPGDSVFSSTSFANKIFGVGVALEGYVGMNDPRANNPVIVNTGAQSPDGGISFMDPNGMSATPYLYLIPVGQDYMRTPPLGDTSHIRSWKVADVSLPLPFNIGASDYSSTRYWQSSESLSEDLFAIRKHQAFRAVSDPEVFNQMTNGMDNYTNNRLIGRSVWNNRWKLIIPGRSLLKNPEEGIERFIRSIEDIKLHFKTYSYSGN